MSSTAAALDVIDQQEKFFSQTRGALEGSVAALRKNVRAFETRLRLSEDDLRQIAESIKALQELIQREVSKSEKANEIRLRDRNTDKVLARLEKLFDNRVGSRMEPEEIDAARKEAKRRIEAKEPPGYKDSGKDDPTGDYIVWRQIMTEAVRRKVPVVFVTDDSRSDDWYEKLNGQPTDARHELREEMTREAGVQIFMMTTATFLDHAKTYLHFTVSPETLNQAKEFTMYYTGPADPASISDAIRSNAMNEMRFSGVRDTVVRHILSGEFDSLMDFGLFADLLTGEIGDLEAMNLILLAIQDGQASGELPPPQAAEAMEVAARYFAEQSPGEPPTRD
jgi:hypothetical protein